MVRYYVTIHQVSTCVLTQKWKSSKHEILPLTIIFVFLFGIKRCSDKIMFHVLVVYKLEAN